MLSFILIIIISLAISYLFTMDSSPVTMSFRETTLSGIPLFSIVFVSIIIGALLASVKTIVNLLTSKLTIMGKNSDLKKSYKETGQLQGKVNKLEEEKSLLKEQLKDSRAIPR